MRVGPQRMIATTGDHPQSLRDSPRQRGGKTVQSLRDSHSGPAIEDGLRPQPTCSPVGSPSSTNSSAVCLTAQPAGEGQSDGGLLPVKNGHVPCLLAGFPYIVPGYDYMLTSRAHISQIIPRNVHHSSKHDAVI